MALLLIFVRLTYNYFTTLGRFMALAILYDRTRFMQVFTEFCASEKFSALMSEEINYYEKLQLNRFIGIT
jgi:hypothetical protein